MMEKENGVVIVVVLWVCALIMWFALQIATETRLQGEEEVHLLRRSQALYLAIGGAYEALARMGRPIPLDSGESGQNWQPDGQPHLVDYQTGQTMVIIEDESRKADINNTDHEVLKKMLERAGVSENSADTLADTIADFVDVDDIPRLNGKEQETYQQMGIMYPPFNGPLSSLDQLLLVPGVTEQLFFNYGDDSTDSREDDNDLERDSAFPGKYSLFQIFSIYGSNRAPQLEDEDLFSTTSEPEMVTWKPNGIYRILSCGKVFTGAPAVLLWLIVQYSPQSEYGYEVLFRKVL
jgi:general secretion pathway protein K